MARTKVSCDYERPSACRRAAVRRIVALRMSDKYQHTSQYCELCYGVAQADVPKGWRIVSDQPIAVPA